MATNPPNIIYDADGNIDYEASLHSAVSKEDFNPYNEAIRLFTQAEKEETKAKVISKLLDVSENRAKGNQNNNTIHINVLNDDDL